MAVQFDNGGYIEFAPISATGAFNISVPDFEYVSNTEWIVGDKSTSQWGIICLSGGVIKVRLFAPSNDINITLSGVSDGDVVSGLTVSRDASDLVTVSHGAVSGTDTISGTVLFSRLGWGGGTSTAYYTGKMSGTLDYSGDGLATVSYNLDVETGSTIPDLNGNVADATLENFTTGGIVANDGGGSPELPTQGQTFPTLEAQPFNSAGVGHNRLVNLPFWMDPFTTEFDFYEDGTTDFDILSYKATGDSYFVDYVNGSDSNDGLTLATAKKTVDSGVSLVRGGAREILTLVGGQRYYDVTVSDLDDLDITIQTTDGTNAVLINGPEDVTSNFSLVSNGMYVWAGAPVYYNILDETFPNYYGKWYHLEKRISSAEVDSLGGWYHDGTDLYIKTPDSRAPDSSIRCLGDSRIRFGGTDNNIYIENVTLYGFRGAPSFSGISKVYFYECEFAYNVQQMFDMSNHTSAQGFFYFVKCVGHSTLKSDIWSASEANYIYLQDCIGCYTSPGGPSTNITTAHGNSCIVAVNSLFVDGEHNICGDTSHYRGVLYLCCRAYKTIAEYTVDNNYGSFKFENDAVDESKGIYIHCDDQDSTGPSFLAQGDVDLLGNNFRAVTPYADATINTEPDYIESANTAPTANAGTNQSVAAGATVQLDGTGSTAVIPAVIASYAWTQTSGDAVTLAGANTATPSFTAPSTNAAQTLTFELTVTDDGGLTATDSVDIQVAAEVVVPVTSTLNLTITGIEAGTQSLKLWSETDNALVYNSTATFTDEAASITLSVPAGTVITGRWLGTNPPTTGTGIYGVTV